MKAVLISIQPKWCELIASGKKIVEVRKTRPKIDTPFKCYIYCTQNGKSIIKDDISTTIGFIAKNGGKVIGEFVCEQIGKTSWCLNPDHPKWVDGFNEETCLTNRETYEYSKGDIFYEWYISDLVIYDKPRELSEFIKPCNHENDCCTCDRYDYIGHRCYNEVTRPPQSWCYVEELK